MTRAKAALAWVHPEGFAYEATAGAPLEVPLGECIAAIRHRAPGEVTTSVQYDRHEISRAALSFASRRG